MKPLLNTLEFQILATMGSAEMAGRAIGAEYEKEFGRINYGTLYTTLRRLRESGFVDSRDDSDDDGRVRYFTLTGNGRVAVQSSRLFYRELAQIGLQKGQLA